MSAICYPDFLRADAAFFWNMAVALAALEGVQQLLGLHHGLTAETAATATATQPVLRLKWPNDLVWVPDAADDRDGSASLKAEASAASPTAAVSWRKLGGLLIENGLGGKRLTHSIVGLGLNLNQAAFPPDLPNPASLWQVDGRQRSPEAALRAFCQTLEPRYEQLQAGATGALKRHYLQALDGYGEWRLYREGQRTFEGRIAGVEDSGHLALEDRNGGLKRYAFKAVERVLPGA